MNLNDLLRGQSIDPRAVLVLRHRPHEPGMRKVLPWLAAEKPSSYNAYQRTQGPKLEQAMQAMVGSGFVASFIGHEPTKALFVGLYSIVASRPLTYEQYWQVPEYAEMRSQFGMQGWSREKDQRTSQLWFDLTRTDFYSSWVGKLVIAWPPPERSWWRRAHRNEIPVAAVLPESAFSAAMPEWNKMEFTWAEFGVLPTPWRSALSQWRGIYYIFDTSDRRGYVGSAYGKDNLLGRVAQLRRARSRRQRLTPATRPFELSLHDPAARLTGYGVRRHRRVGELLEGATPHEATVWSE
jgi:hypothetical protein